METLTIFKDPEGNYFNVVVDGRIIDGLGKDEALMTVACHLIGAAPPPYANGKTIQELREAERARGAFPFTRNNTTNEG